MLPTWVTSSLWPLQLESLYPAANFHIARRPLGRDFERAQRLQSLCCLSICLQLYDFYRHPVSLPLKTPRWASAHFMTSWWSYWCSEPWSALVNSASEVLPPDCRSFLRHVIALVHGHCSPHHRVLAPHCSEWICRLISIEGLHQFPANSLVSLATISGTSPIFSPFICL